MDERARDVRTGLLKHACVDAGQYGLNVSATDYADDGVRFLRTTDLGGNGIAEGGVFLPTPIAHRFQVCEGDLLLSRAGTIGQAYLARRSDEGSAFVGYLVRFRPLDSTDPRFLYYTTQSQPFQDQVASEAVVSTIANFNADRYANVRIPLPTPDAQRRIADFLDDQVARIDNIIAARIEQRKMFALVCDRQIDDLLWSGAATVPLKYLVGPITSGPRGWGDLVTDVGRPFFRIGNLSRRGIDLVLADVAHVDVPDSAESRRATVQCGDVLVGITASLGDVSLVGPDFAGAAFSQHVARLRPNPARADSKWLAWTVQSLRVREALTTSGYGGTKVGLGLSEVGAVSVPFTNIATQRSTADAADEVWGHHEAARVAMAESTTRFQELRRSLITAAVTGEFDVSSADGSRVPA